MFKRLTIIVAVVLLMSTLAGCKLRTPEIRGVVLDAETGEPVEGAWISSTLTVKTKTVGGDVHSYLSVGQPHTRTDKEGRFIIPSKKFKKPPFPIGFGTEVESFSVNANTIDDKSGGFYLKREEYIGKKQIEVVIYVKPWKKGLTDEREYNSYIRALYNYCLTGRFGIEVPPVEGGCDEWELDFAIAKHERFLKRLGEPKTMDQRTYYTGTMRRLAYLYKKKGDYKKAIETFKKVKEFKEKRGSKLWIKEFEFQINELQRLLDKEWK